MLLFQVSAPHLSITPGSGSLRSLFSDQFLGTVMLSDVTVIVSQRNADINLMLAKKKNYIRCTCERRSARWHTEQ